MTCHILTDIYEKLLDMPRFIVRQRAHVFRQQTKIVILSREHLKLHTHIQKSIAMCMILIVIVFFSLSLLLLLLLILLILVLVLGFGTIVIYCVDVAGM